MCVALGRSQKPAPDFRYLSASAASDAMHALLGDPGDLPRIGRGEAAAARERVRIVPRKDGDAPGADFLRGNPLDLDLDRQPARADEMVADQPLRLREEGGEMFRREMRQHAEFAAELAVDDHAPRQA